MITRHVKKFGYKLHRKQILQVLTFIVIFGFFVAGVSALINTYFDPAHNPAVRQFLTYEDKVFVLYFIYVMVASIAVAIPTLPVDVVLMNLMDPISIIVIRLGAGLAGASVNYFLAHRYGRPLLERWLSKKNYNFVIDLSNNLKWQHFFIITMIPIINTELMAYAGGISKLRFRWVLGTLALGLLYRILFVYFVLRA